MHNTALGTGGCRGEMRGPRALHSRRRCLFWTGQWGQCPSLCQHARKGRNHAIRRHLNCRCWVGTRRCAVSRPLAKNILPKLPTRRAWRARLLFVPELPSYETTDCTARASYPSMWSACESTAGCEVSAPTTLHLGTRHPPRVWCSLLGLQLIA